MNIQEPDRPIPSQLRPLRATIRFARRVWHQTILGRKLTLGKNVILGRSAFLAPPEFLKLGNNVAIGSHFHLEANLVVGDDVLISSRVAIIGNDHRFDSSVDSIFWAGRLAPSLVTIEGDNLIGFGTTIIGNVTIGRGCIVGACAVVTKDLPANTICVGVPAKPIRDRVQRSTE